HGVLFRHAPVLARGSSAARRLLRQILCVLGGDQGGVVHACCYRRRHQRGGRLLLSRDRQDDVFRRPGQALRTDAARAQGRVGGNGLIQSPFLRLSQSVGGGRRRRGKGAVLMKFDPE